VLRYCDSGHLDQNLVRKQLQPLFFSIGREKGKSAEKRGRKASGLNPFLSGHDGRAAAGCLNNF